MASSSPRPIIYFLSDAAFDHLWRMAVRANYIRPGSKYGRGLSSYLNELSQSEFKDMRPDEFKESDEARLAKKLTLFWEPGLERAQRCLKLDETAIDNYSVTAFKHKIGFGRSHRTSSVYIRTQTTVVSKVLEAIGIGWLVADTLPARKQRPEPPSRRGQRSGVLL